MSNSNGMYNVLNIFKKLQPLTESTAKEVAKEIYESVESKGSILEGVSKVEAKLREEYETLKTKTGTIHKVGRYGNEVDVNADGTKKKHVPKTGQRGRPKAEKPTSYDSPKGDIFGRTTGAIPKGKGTVIKGKANQDTVDEGEVVDVKGGKVHKGHYGYETDVNADGSKKKHVPKAGQRGRPKADKPASYDSPKGDIFGRTTGSVPKGKKGTVVKGKANIDTVDEGRRINEGINFSEMMKETEMSVSEMFAELQQDMDEYKRTGRCSDKLEAYLKIHNHGKRQAEMEAAPVPYEVPAVQRKAAGAAPLTPGDVQAQDAARSMHPGMTKLNAPAPANGPVATPASKLTATEELDELARLAGISEAKSPKADKDYDKDGEVESEKDEVIGSRRKAAGLDEAKPDFLDMDKDGDKKEPMKKALKDKVEENCDMSIAGGAQDMQDQAGRISVNTSASSDGNRTVNISADGDAAEQLMQMLKMAGMGGQQAEKHVQLMVAKPEGDEEVDEASAEYANTPNEEYGSVEQITSQGTDMNRQKKQFADKPRQGDNPMATENIDIVSHMGRDLMAEYQAMKLSK